MSACVGRTGCKTNDRQRKQGKNIKNNNNNNNKTNSVSERYRSLTRCPRTKEGHVLFNNALDTFYLWRYRVKHMVKNNPDSERGNPLPPHGLLFPINNKGSFMHHPTNRIAHTTVFVTQVVGHWLERETAQWVHPMKDRSDDPSHHE